MSSGSLRTFIQEVLREAAGTSAFDIARLLSGGGRTSQVDVDMPVGGDDMFDIEEPLTSDANLSPVPRALVTGDSQAGGALGRAFKDALEAEGFKVTMGTHVNGGAGDQIVRTTLENAEGHDLVVVVWGGNESSVDSARDTFEEIHDGLLDMGIFFIAVGPPPATRITDLGRARSVFGDDVMSDDYHMLRRGGKYAEIRVKIAEAIENAARGKDLAKGYGIALHHTPGVDYPDQPDGVHCQVGAEAVVSSVLEAVDFAQIASRIRSARDALAGSGPDPGRPT